MASAIAGPRVRQVSARAPTRIDLAGGTLDLWPIHHLLDRKATVNVGVSLDARADVKLLEPGNSYRFSSKDQAIEVRGEFAAITATSELPLLGLLTKAIWRADLPRISIETSARSPAGAGLGGSSCLGITVAGALWRMRSEITGEREPEEAALLRIVQDVEARLIRSPTGVQDYWGGLRGNVNILRFPYGGTKVETLAPEKVAGLEDELILCYSGKSRASAINNWKIFKRLFDGDQDLLRIFNEIGAVAEDCAAAAAAGNFGAMIELSMKEWALRVKLWPNIETTETKIIDQAAKANGARFSRVCGAGGGGVMAVFAPKDRKKTVAEALRAAGGTVLDAGVAHYGLEVTATHG